MVTGNEYVFLNLDEALSYLLEMEKKALEKDEIRQKSPFMINPFTRQPIAENSLDYPISAYFNNASADKFIMTRLKSGRYSLKPNLRERKYLFRGESEFHSPCRPNLFRCKKPKKVTGELAAGQEMMLLMLSHPLVQLLDLGIELNDQTFCFEMNLYGLTQHYYNKTSLLDLTSNPQVAAFFATTSYDWSTDTYTPILNENHDAGILYYYSLDVISDFSLDNLSTIGLQVFPRSGRQSGFLYSVKEREFNQEPQLHAIRFRHNAQIAQRIFDESHGSADLFPEDILMKHWKACNRDKNILSNRTVRLNQIMNSDSSVEELTCELKALGYEIHDYVPSFTLDELKEYYENIKNGLWDEFCSRIHIPGDDGSMLKALRSLPDDDRYRWAFEPNITLPKIDYNKGYLLQKYAKCLV